MATSSFPYVLELRGAALWFTLGAWVAIGGAFVVGFLFYTELPLFARLALSFVSILIVALVCVGAVRDKKILYEDAIEFVTLFGATRFAISELAGYRKRRIRNLPFAFAHELTPRDASVQTRKLVTIPGALPQVDAWLAKLPELAD